MLNGIAHPFKNDIMIILGIISCISMVMIAFFDMHEYGPIHNPCALVFFSSATIEALMYSYEMTKHKDKFPENDTHVIGRLGPLSWSLLGAAIIFGISIG